MTSKGRVLVAGATGYLGKHVVRALHGAGYEVVALARKAAKLDDVKDLCADVFVGEATDDSTLDGLCEGVDAVFSSLGIRAFSGPITYEHVDFRANMNVLQRAQQAGCKRMVVVAGLHGEKGRAMGPQVDARERVVDALKATDIAWTILRPTGFFNDMSEFFTMAEKGTVWMIGDGTGRINPIHGADLAAQVVRALADDESIGAQWDLGGPEILTMREIAELALEVAGKADKGGKIRSVPGSVMRFVGALASPFSANFSNTMKFFGSMELFEGVGDRVGEHTLRAFFEELRDAGGAENLGLKR